jgi:hypothetical protein
VPGGAQYKSEACMRQVLCAHTRPRPYLERTVAPYPWRACAPVRNLAHRREPATAVGHNVSSQYLPVQCALPPSRPAPPAGDFSLHPQEARREEHQAPLRGGPSKTRTGQHTHQPVPLHDPWAWAWRWRPRRRARDGRVNKHSQGSLHASTQVAFSIWVAMVSGRARAWR